MNKYKLSNGNQQVLFTVYAQRVRVDSTRVDTGEKIHMTMSKSESRRLWKNLVKDGYYYTH